MRKFLNVKVGVELFNLLQSNPLFKDNWKVISAIQMFLKRVSGYNNSNNGESSEVYSSIIYDMFKPYTGGSYRQYLDALVILELLVIDDWYKVGTEANGGCCKKYLVTDKGNMLLSSSNTEYLKKLHFDPLIIRGNQKRISKRKIMKRNYADYVLNYIHDGLIHMEYDYNKAMNTISGSNWSEATKQVAGQSLIAFKEKDFTELHYNISDGRVFNELAGMKSDLRTHFTYKNMGIKAIIDIRACHPTFFSTYIYNNSLSTTLPYPYHIVPDKGDISPLEILQKEHNTWIELFTNPHIDPREIIAKECGYTKEECKHALNQTINGSKKWTLLSKWMETKFPYLCQLWNSMEKSKTGNLICKEYESKLMLDPQLYRYTEDMKIKFGYEYDGVSIFALDSNTTLVDQINFLLKYIKCFSERNWGVPLVIKVEFITEEEDPNTITFEEWKKQANEIQAQPLLRQVEKELARWTQFCRGFFGGQLKNWDEYKRKETIHNKILSDIKTKLEKLEIL